ncbi:UNVERIFIED_CONTAM: hypothetical protein Sradi_6847600 [Sesamum radiatum]|uniref:CCHC-type domain-containing protein n=1 Tax=Sesamum radiatum TaxID=300843 RepID=A0AAW2JNH5_SESRA
MTAVSPMHLEMCCARRSCGHSRCPSRIGGSYVEQLGTTRSQVISIAAWSRMETDAQFHALDQGRETVDGRTVPVRTRSLNAHATIHLVSMCHGPLLDGHPWIVLDFKNQGYVLDKPLPVTLPEGSSPEERLTFEKWHEDNRKLRSIILASMTNEIQKQYDRLDDVPSIMLRLKDVYAIPDQHIRYAATKAFFGTKMTEGSSVHSHGVKMLSLVEKLEDLKAGLDNDTQHRCDPSFIHELINMLVQYEATTHKSEPAVLVGEASTSKAKGKGSTVTATASTGGAPPAAPKGKGKGKVGGSQRSKANDVCMHCQGKGHWKRECPQLLSNPGMFVVEVNMISNFASWVLDTAVELTSAMICRLLQRSRKLSKDEMILRLGDGKAVAAEAMGSLRLVVSSHIRID